MLAFLCLFVDWLAVAAVFILFLSFISSAFNNTFIT